MQWKQCLPAGKLGKQRIRYVIGVAEGTPFEGGVFKMKLVLGSEFPTAPPKGVSLSPLAATGIMASPVTHSLLTSPYQF